MKEGKKVQESILELVRKVRDESTEILGKAESELKTIGDSLIAKGKITQADGKRIFEDLAGKVKTRREELEKRFDEGAKKIASYLNLPQKTEVERLSERVDTLSRKVKTLKEQLAKKK
jgi:polyhydroxyalkanoate synthesis regulator phasin